MIRNLIKILLIVVIFTGCTKQLMIEDYYRAEASIQMFGQNPERNFYYSIKLPDSLKLEWDNSTKGSFGNNSVLFEGNYLYVTDLAGNFFCFSADSGETIGADKGNGEIPVAPILDNGWNYYINTVDGETYSNLIRYDVRRGERNKEVQIPGRVGNELIKFDDGIFLISENGSAKYFDKFLEIVWETEIGESVNSSPAANPEFIYIGTLNGKIVALEKSTGELMFENDLSNSFQSAIILTDKLGFVGDVDGNLIAFDLKTGSEKWRSVTDAKIVTPPVHDEKYVYASNLGGSIYCFDLQTGEEIWSYNSTGIFNAPPALFKNVLLQPDLNQKVLFLDPKDGSLIKQWKFEERVKLHPVYFNGFLYIGLDRGEILAYRLISEIK